jgi:hypothetical protein
LDLLLTLQTGVQNDSEQLNAKYGVDFGGGFDLSVFLNRRRLTNGMHII